MKKSLIIFALPLIFMACSDKEDNFPDNEPQNSKSTIQNLPEADCGACPAGTQCFLPFISGVQDGSDSALIYLNSLSDAHPNTKAWPGSDECTPIEGWDDFNYHYFTGTGVPFAYGNVKWNGQHIGCCFPEDYLDQIWSDAYAWALTLDTPPGCQSPNEPYIGLEFVRNTSTTCNINLIVRFLCCGAPEEEEQN